MIVQSGKVLVQAFWFTLFFIPPKVIHCKKELASARFALFQHLFTTSAHLYARSPWRFTMSVRPCTKQTL